MAIGKKGSFATTNPNAGVIDVAGMAERASTRQSEILERKVGLESQLKNARFSLAEKLATPEVAPTGQKTFDEIQYTVASDLKEKRYEVYQSFNRGEMTLPEMRAKAAEFDRQVDNFATNIGRFKQGAEQYQELYANDDLSRGIPRDEHGKDGFMVKVLNGQIDRIENEDGTPVFVVGGKKMTLDSINSYLTNPPRSVKIDDESQELADEFVTRIEKRAGALNEGMSYYESVVEEGLSVGQKNEIRSLAEAKVKSPKFVGDLWFQYTGEEGVYTTDDLSEAELAELTEWTKEKYVQSVENRVKNRFETDYDIGQAGVDTRDRLDRQAEKEETAIQLGEPTPANVGQFPGGLRAINEYNKKVEGVQRTIDESEFAGSISIPILNDNATFPNLQLSDDTGKMRDFNNVTIKGVARTPSGQYVVTGYRKVSKGGTVTKDSGRVTRSFSDVDLQRISQEDRERLKELEESGTELELNDFIKRVSTRYNISEPKVSQSVQREADFESFSAVVPEPTQLLPRLGVSEDMFTRQESQGESIADKMRRMNNQ